MDIYSLVVILVYFCIYIFLSFLYSFAFLQKIWIVFIWVTAFYSVFAKYNIETVVGVASCFVFGSCLLLMINAEFIALAMLLISVGAISILFLFTVILVEANKEPILLSFFTFFSLVFLCGSAVIFTYELAFITQPEHIRTYRLTLAPTERIFVPSVKQAWDGADTISFAIRYMWDHLYLNYYYYVPLIGFLLFVPVIVALPLLHDTQRDQVRQFHIGKNRFFSYEIVGFFFVTNRNEVTVPFFSFDIYNENLFLDLDFSFGLRPASGSAHTFGDYWWWIVSELQHVNTIGSTWSGWSALNVFITDGDRLKRVVLTQLREFVVREVLWTSVVSSILLIVGILVAVAFFTLAERKLMAAAQRRVGPDVAGFAGVLQAVADGVKLVLKEIIVPRKANKVLFIFAPVYFFVLSLVTWGLIPFGATYVYTDVDCSLLAVFALASLSVYGIVLAGWASNSKYAFLGALRGVAQLVSYEISLGLIFVCVSFLAQSLNLLDIVYAQKFLWFVFPLFPLFCIFFICALAETNRVPFDLVEAEAEIVAGFNVEYSGILFGMFFLAEYSNILRISATGVILFFGGWWPLPLGYAGSSFFIVLFSGFPDYLLFILKTLCFVFFFIICRSALPRYRFDQLMTFGWKSVLPFVLAFTSFVLVFVAGFFILLVKVESFEIPFLLSDQFFVFLSKKKLLF